MKMKELTESLDKIKVSGQLEATVSGIAYHSKKVVPGSVFVAIAGFKENGAKFISDAISRGAIGIVSEEDPVDAPGIIHIQVPNARAALAALASRFFEEPSKKLHLIGITGTNGKTTITFLLESILSAAGFSPGVIGTINYRFGNKKIPAPTTTPESLDLQEIFSDMIKSGTTHVAMEVSSIALTLSRLKHCHFDIACFTNLTQDHLDFHGDTEEYFNQKKRFFTEYLNESSKSDKVAVLNSMDEASKKIRKELRVPAIYYGLKGDEDVTSKDVKFTSKGIDATISIPDGEFKLHSDLIGRFNLENILAATACAVAAGIPPKAIKNGVEDLKNVPGRLERVSNKHGFDVFVDYAHTPDALIRVTHVAREFTKGRLLVVFGCGGDRDKLKRPLMGKAVADEADIAIVTSDNPRTEDPEKIIEDIIPGMKNSNAECVKITDRRDAIYWAVKKIHKDDILVIAGKGHEDYQIIGTKKNHFDDCDIVREALDAL